MADKMANDFYSGFSEIPEFAEASEQDKLRFGQIWAEEAMKDDPEFFADPENQQALVNEVQGQIRLNLESTKQAAEREGTITAEEPSFLQRVGEEAAGLGRAFVETARKGIVAIGEDAIGKMNRAAGRSLSGNVKATGEFAEEVILGAVGAVGRVGLDELTLITYRLPSFVTTAIGQGDSTFNKWLQANIEEVEGMKDAMSIYKGELSRMPDQVIMAGITGYGVGGFIQKGMAKALNNTLILGTPGYSAADAAIVTGYTAMLGEGLVVSPGIIATDHYIDNSGYNPETKQVLKMVAPILMGVVSGLSFENRLDKILGNPTVVNRIEDMVRGGAGPAEVAAEVQRVVKAPQLFDEVKLKADGIVSSEKLVSNSERNMVDTVRELPAVKADVLPEGYLEGLSPKRLEEMRAYYRRLGRPETEIKAIISKYFSKWTNPEPVENALTRYYDAWAKPRTLVEDVPPARDIFEEALPGTEREAIAPVRAAAPTVVSTEAGPRIEISSLTDEQARAVQILGKHYSAENLEKFLRIGTGDTQIGQVQVENMVGLTYRIPQNRTWTVEMFDDMITAARSAEDLYDSVLKAGAKRPSEMKVEVLGQVERYIAEGRYDQTEGEFISKMIKVLKRDDIFSFLPVREIDGVSKNTAGGSYFFGKNLIRLKDVKSLPHEIGHWGFMNGLTGAERIKVLETVREKLAGGWVPGENLTKQKFALFPDSPGKIHSNAELDIDEYFAEQYAQFMYTNHATSFELKSIFQSVNRWMSKFFHAMRNEKLVDNDLVPFFQQFAAVERRNTLLFGDVSQFNKTLEDLSDIVLNTRTFAARLKTKIDPAKHGDPFSRGPAFQATRKFFKEQVLRAANEGKLTAEDARKFLSSSDVALSEMVFDPRNSTITRNAVNLGLTGQANPALNKMWSSSISNSDGFVDPDFLRTIGIHSVPLMWGFEARDGKIGFNVNKYVKGAAVWYGLGLGGKFYRKVGAAGGLKRVGSKFADKFWGNLLDVPKEVPLRELSIPQALKRVTGGVLNSLRPTEGIDPDVWALGRQFRAEHRQLQRKLEEFAAYLKKNFTREEREMISDIIEEEGDDWARMPKVLHEQAAEVRNMLKTVREKLISSGVDPEVVNRYGDKWLHRVYIPKLANRKTYDLAKKRLKTIQGHYLMRRGKTKTLNSTQTKFNLPEQNFKQGDKVYSFLDTQAKKRWAHSSQTKRIDLLTKRYGKPTEWKVVEPVKGKVQLLRPWTKAEREAMGESRDVALRLGVFFRESSHDIALGHMFKTVGETPGYVMEVPTGMTKLAAKELAAKAGFELLPKTSATSGMLKFGELGGKYVRSDVVKVLKNLTGPRYTNELVEAISTYHRIGLGLWKLAKTAYNPATHMLNSITNVHLCLMDGRDPVSTIYNGIESLVRKGQYYQDAIDAGLVDSGMRQAEWNLNAFVSSVTDVDPTDVTQAGRISQGLAKAWRGIKTVGRSPLKLYEWEDEVFKLGVFIAERNAGKNPDEALAAANRIFFDYSDVPSGVQFLRDTGIMPFISYTYKVIPVIARAFVEHPERMAALLVAYKVAGDWVYENEFADKAMAQKKLETAVQPEWRQRQLFGAGPGGQIRLPTDPETGEARALDVSRYLPGADLFEDTGQSFPFGTHPLISLLYGWKSNKHASFGRKLLPFEDPKTDLEKEQNLDATLSLISNTLLPNVPGIPYTYATERVGNALVASGDIDENSGWLWDVAQKRGWTGKNFFGHEVKLSEELLNVAGLKISRTDVPAAISLKEQKIYGRVKEAEKQLFREAMSQKSTPARMEAQTESFEQTVNQVSTELDELSRLVREAR